MTGRSTPAEDGHTDDPIRTGSVPGTDAAAGQPGPVPAS